MSTTRHTGSDARGACAPGVRTTRSLLGYGLIAGPFYVLASVIEGIVRPGFDFTRHDWSLLANGDVGWIHMVVLAVTGLMVVAAAAGFVRALRGGRRSGAAGWFLAVYGAGMIGAGVFAADPADGFPLGTPDGPTVTPSIDGLLHLAFGGLGFLGLVICCLILARLFRKENARGWAGFSLATGVLFLAAFVGIASGGAATRFGVLAFTAAVLLAWTWLFLVSSRMYRLTG
ncbi:MAG: DUF998 domain-containing protein [Pseudonocardia sp.]|nr:DUF998 domain-containing protein [Pseudonocardia sp.]